MSQFFWDSLAPLFSLILHTPENYDSTLNGVFTLLTKPLSKVKVTTRVLAKQADNELAQVVRSFSYCLLSTEDMSM